MTAGTTDIPNPIPKDRLVFYWTIIGAVLLVASVAQPIVSSQLVSIPPEELLAPMQEYMGDQPMPTEVTALFAGVFANIQFSLLFAAVKLVAGGTILYAARSLAGGADWAPRVLQGAALIGIAAFIGIGLYFAYSSIIIGGAMDVPLIMSLMMIVFGGVVAFFPARWLWRNSRSLGAL
ncbi:hypothetical protein [Cognatiyoonia sp. IB215182]|uniref:hypothetical protein n=1 Tax=Cognatiyoonia sp. IB215182 TaxID=3097353 RepID=UPI002A16BC85|nr:hypothetical protein [Cognatiyoonia sp. IB215182]MDX8355204.1 hypothetical protein [Cognatiyoonia sp. IB215182]